MIVGGLINIFINKEGPAADNLCKYYHPDGVEPVITAEGHRKKAVRVSFATNKGHIALDAVITRFLEHNQCRSSEISKINSVRGIPPA